MSGVLVLNATWEPVARTSLGRAVSMIKNGVAVIHEAVPWKLLRSANWETEHPRIIRLLRYVKVKRQHAPAPWSRRGVLLRDNYECAYNGPKCTFKATTVDHIHPKTKGGENTWKNTVASCYNCNNKKDRKTLEEVGFTLNIKPWIPSKADLANSEYNI